MIGRAGVASACIIIITWVVSWAQIRWDDWLKPLPIGQMLQGRKLGISSIMLIMRMGAAHPDEGYYPDRLPQPGSRTHQALA